ncbi:MAG: GntR family transcriptional regulator [Oscillospiraceae bacterium]|nr:GntR family transcriptional regulator [Oscillospiraceae bacterium]
MAWELLPDRPFYTQLLEHLQVRIMTGVYAAGQRLPSVRDLAEEASVNVNTMQRALTELEQAGLVNTQRTAGRFITGDQGRIDALRTDLAALQARGYLQGMARLGFAPQEALAFLARQAHQNEGAK